MKYLLISLALCTPAHAQSFSMDDYLKKKGIDKVEKVETVKKEVDYSQLAEAAEIKIVRLTAEIETLTKTEERELDAVATLEARAEALKVSQDADSRGRYKVAYKEYQAEKRKQVATSAKLRKAKRDLKETEQKLTLYLYKTANSTTFV